MNVFDVLPFEIKCEIFSHLEKGDCLECMRVCRDWFVNVPKYTLTLWRSIDFDGQIKENIGKKNQCLLQCLGPHVKSVCVPYEQMHHIFAEFTKRGGAKVNSLYIAPQSNDITGIIYNGGAGIENPQFFDALKVVGTHLVKLEMCSIRDVSFLEIAKICPLLKYFSYQLPYANFAHENPDMTMRSSGDSSSSTDNPPLLPHLIYLDLDSKFNFDVRIAPILSHCPNLRIMRLYHHEPDRTVPRQDFDFAQVLEQCPRLFHLECYHSCLPNDNYSEYIDALEEDVAIEDAKNSANGEAGGLSQLIFRQNRKRFHASKMIPFLQKVQHCLKTLVIVNPPNEINDWHMQENTRLNSLQDLTIIEECFDDDTLLAPSSLAQFLQSYTQQSTMALENVTLHTHSDSIDDNVMKALKNLRGLRSLDLNCDSNFVFYHHTFPANPRLFGELRYLQQVEVCGKLFISDILLDALSVLPHLKIAILEYRNFLHDLQLAEPDVEAVTPPSTITSSGFEKFAKNLERFNHGNFERLVLKRFHNLLDNPSMEALGSILSLKSLVIADTIGLTLGALKSFSKAIGKRSADNEQVLISNGVKIHIHNCYGITRDNLKTILV